MASKEMKTASPRKTDKPAREGDVLGISDVVADGTIERPEDQGDRHVRGIEVRSHSTGIGDVPHRAGASSIDMGASGEGTGIDARPSRPRLVEREKDE
jgi:hypothetical protein